MEIPFLARSRPRTIAGGLNALGTMRIRAHLTQEDLSAKLGRDTSWISRTERKPLVHFWGRRREILQWASACGFGASSHLLQLFLLETGNAPDVPEGSHGFFAALAAALADAIAKGDAEPVKALTERKARRLMSHALVGLQDAGEAKRFSRTLTDRARVSDTSQQD